MLDEDEGVALRGLFIIDPEGVIMHATINNLPVGRNVDETLRVLQVFQYVQSNPDEVCPANWTPGEKTMKPDPVGSKEFFAAINWNSSLSISMMRPISMGLFHGVSVTTMLRWLSNVSSAVSRSLAIATLPPSLTTTRANVGNPPCLALM